LLNRNRVNAFRERKKLALRVSFIVIDDNDTLTRQNIPTDEQYITRNVFAYEMEKIRDRVDNLKNTVCSLVVAVRILQRRR
jgi:hypothetical protein